MAISNRVPSPQRGVAPGGLAVGLLAAMRARGGLWFGWNGEISDVTGDEPAVFRKNNVAYATIDLDEKEYAQYYLGFCNSVLWPLFHYFVDGFRYREEQYAAYLGVNRRFARNLKPLLDTDDLVWVHDYHLIPLAQELRKRGARQAMGLFLHIPFPHIEVLRVLPVFAELLQALLAYDVLGFQTEADCSAFRTAVAQVWGPDVLRSHDAVLFGGRVVRTLVVPIGVDVDGIQKQAADNQSTETCRRMIDGLSGRKLMIGVDRLDYSKGLVERFRAYEKFLEAYPENQSGVTFLQIAPLSRSSVRAYEVIRRDLEQTTGRINGRFADTDWTPIRYLNRNFSHDKVTGFMRAALVGIVTPVRDGMNLVAKEFIAAQDPDDPGVLVLSNMAGAARELGSAILVNPYDSRGMANAIQQAFNMPLGERRERHQELLNALKKRDLNSWHGQFVESMDTARACLDEHPRPT